MKTRDAVRALAVLAALWGRAGAEEPKKIQDNSFLIEEAYNQEPGVVQHIQTYQYLRRAKAWAYSFTEEWPAPGRAHQVSVTVPALHWDQPDRVTGLGDLALNYRYQLVLDGPRAVAPRLSLLLPTGDFRKGLGNGAPGLQGNLPVSVELSDRWVMHWNLGATFVPGAREPGGASADTLSFNYGASAVFLATPGFNLMAEAAFTDGETVLPGGGRTRAQTAFVNPGLRAAFDFPSGLQVVPGLSFPLGVGASKGERGILAYLSFEHPLF